MSGGSKKGLFVGKSHANGGIPSEVVETGQLLEIEGDEYYICRSAYNSSEVYDFKGKTNKQILDKLYTTYSCKLVQSEMSAGDFIICKVVVRDKSKHDRSGTVKEILNQMQAEKSCKVEDSRNVKLQEGGRITDNSNFVDWFGDSKVIDNEGEPLVVYHGTTHDFDSFELERGNINNAVGKGYYFTSSPDDASINYAGVGADLTQRIEMEYERIEQSFEIEYSIDELVDEFSITEDQASEIINGENPELASVLAKRKARKTHKGEHDGAVIPAYIRMEKPFDLAESGGYIIIEKDEDYYLELAEDEVDRDDFDDEEEYEEALIEKSNEIYSEDYNPSEHGEGVELMAAFEKMKWRYDDIPAELEYKLRGSFIDGISPKDFYEMLRLDLSHVMTNEGEFASTQIFNDIIQEAGYDGIIQDAYEEFGEGRSVGRAMDGISYGDRHYIVFEPTQIKSAIGNKGDFDPNNPDIIMYRGGEIESYNEWKSIDWDSFKLDSKLRSNVYRILGWDKSGRIDWGKLPKEDKTWLEEEIIDELSSEDTLDYIFSDEIEGIEKGFETLMKEDEAETNKGIEKLLNSEYGDLKARIDKHNISYKDLETRSKEEILKGIYEDKDIDWVINYFLLSDENWLDFRYIFKDDINRLGNLYHKLLDEGAVFTEEAEEAQIDMFTEVSDVNLKEEVELQVEFLEDLLIEAKESKDNNLSEEIELQLEFLSDLKAEEYKRGGVISKGDEIIVIFDDNIYPQHMEIYRRYKIGNVEKIDRIGYANTDIYLKDTHTMLISELSILGESNSNDIEQVAKAIESKVVKETRKTRIKFN